MGTSTVSTCCVYMPVDSNTITIKDQMFNSNATFDFFDSPVRFSYFIIAIFFLDYSIFNYRKYFTFIRSDFVSFSIRCSNMDRNFIQVHCSAMILKRFYDIWTLIYHELFDRMIFFRDGIRNENSSWITWKFLLIMNSCWQREKFLKYFNITKYMANIFSIKLTE